MYEVMKMTLLMNLLPLLFLAVLIRSDQNMSPLRSFKISENAIYDCIDIYKQPGLDHPLLKNHTIQMKPSFRRFESKNQTRNTKTYEKKTRCPDGTVPILRTSKVNITNAQLFSNKYLHQLTKESPGTHIAGIRLRNHIYRGGIARFSIHNLQIEKDQASYTQISIGTNLRNQLNFVTAGWMINPSLYGDGRVWSYGSWQGKYEKGCYNTECPGFVQVSKEAPITQPLDPQREGFLYYSIHQDTPTGNWWLTNTLQDGSEVDIGYWPVQLFNLMVNGANMVGVGGVVQASPQSPSPPMGNGKFPSKGKSGSAVFTNIEVVNSNYDQVRFDAFPVENLLTSPKCYGLNIAKMPIIGFFFTYGGRGGNSCGI